MNEFVPVPKPKPFPRRKQPILPQATSSPETFNRFVVAKAQGLLQRRDPFKIANERWPGDRRLSQVINRAATEPATPANTQALGATMTFDAIRSLQAVSAAARVMANPDSLQLVFDRYERISIPDFIGLDEGPPPFVAPGHAVPVGQLTSSAAGLDPFKLEFIVIVSKEMILGSNAERLVGDALRTKLAMGLDQALFDAQPADDGRPPGLRWLNLPLPGSASVDNATAMMQDVNTLVAAAENIAAAAPYFFIARSRRISAMRIMMKQVPPNFVLLATAAGQALPESVLLCLMPTAFASAVGAPEVELVEQAAVEMNDAPGSPDLMQGQRVHSMFQHDTVGIKVRIPASWTLRHPAAANWITCIWPSDIGGGGEGMPEAPFDEFHYGRHQSGWTLVVEETPATPPGAAWVRASFGSPGGWYQLSDLLTGYAPLDSPAFRGAPTGPTPPAADRSDRLATTQFVADNAPSGGGLEDVPAETGAYARVRVPTGAEWMDFNTIGVASLDSPAFRGNPTAPTQAPGDSSTRLANTQFLARDYIARAGGQMDGPLITVGGSSVTNLGLSIGDNSTGFYRPNAGVLIAAVSGVATAQFMPAVVAFFVPVNLGNNVIQAVGDATQDTDALNRRSGDSRYLRQNAQIVSPTGSSTANDVGLGVGDRSTGFYRDGADLVLSQLGFPLAMFLGSRAVAFNGPLSMAGNAINAVGDPAAGAAGNTDALNRRTADARYLQTAGGFMEGPLQLFFTPAVNADAVTKGYVDQLARGQPVIYDLPANVNVLGNDAWFSVGVVRIIFPRAGNSRIAVAITCNVTELQGIVCADLRLSGSVTDGGARLRRVWLYGATSPPPVNLACGFTTVLYAEVSGATVDVPVQIKSRAPATGAPPDFTIIGGGATIDLCSQITITDLGPVTAADEPADEAA